MSSLHLKIHCWMGPYAMFSFSSIFWDWAAMSSYTGAGCCFCCLRPMAFQETFTKLHHQLSHHMSRPISMTLDKRQLANLYSMKIWHFGVLTWKGHRKTVHRVQHLIIIKCGHHEIDMMSILSGCSCWCFPMCMTASTVCSVDQNKQKGLPSDLLPADSKEIAMGDFRFATGSNLTAALVEGLPTCVHYE